MFKSYQYDTDGKKMDRRMRKSARRAIFEYNKGVSKLLREKRREAKRAAENA